MLIKTQFKVLNTFDQGRTKQRAYFQHIDIYCTSWFYKKQRDRKAVVLQESDETFVHLYYYVCIYLFICYTHYYPFREIWAALPG